MRHAIFALFFFGCTKEPDPTLIKPVELPHPASMMTPATAPQSQGAGLAPNKAVDDSLANGLLIARDQVGYSEMQKKIVFAESSQQEGTGAGLTVVFLGTDGKGREALEIYTPGEDEETKTKEALPKLIERLAKEGYTALPKTDWPEGKVEVSPFGGLTMSWKKNELAAARNGEVLNTFKKKIKPEKPFKTSPTAVYTSNTSPMIVIALNHDPGSAYGEGFNVFISYEVLGMPPSLKN